MTTSGKSDLALLDIDRQHAQCSRQFKIEARHARHGLQHVMDELPRDTRITCT
ncbi:MAG: hypothetical protein JW839_05245 [Candidatus Lokiarchaeota archaeon]|nr:hypothetical protein [Candidatus Lokiarchaeota archaeon]